MSEFKGTKGKWYKGLTNDVKQVGTKKVIADCCFFDNDRAIEEANALLISKAPEMLEMLHRIENILTYDTIEPNSPLQEEIYNLIKQATEI